MKKNVMLVIGILGAMIFMFPMPGNATMVQWDLGGPFSGVAPSVSPGPWVRATFDDGGTTGSVTLTLEDLNLSGAEFVTQWYFNVDPSITPSALTFTNVSGPSATVSLGSDAFKADGDGLYDILFLFDTSNGKNSDRFNVGDTVVYAITGSGITAGSFDFLSAPAGGVGPFPTAAKVQGIGPNDESGWVSVPEPSTMFLLGFSLLGIAVFGRKLRKN